MSRRRAFDMSELSRWAACGLVVMAAHGSAAAIIANWADPIDASDPAGAITMVLAPDITTTADTQEDIAPGPQMVQAETPPEVKPDEKLEEKPIEEPTPEPKVVVEEKIEPQPDQPQIGPALVAPKPEVVAALPPPKPEPRHVKPKPARPAAPATTAPQRAPRLASVAAAPSQGQLSASSSAMPNWKGAIVAAIQRNLRYPSEATTLGMQSANVAFSIDRGGRLLSSRLVRSSGIAALDQEALAVLRRAQPFPTPPAEVVGSHIDLTIPVRFTRR